MAETRTALIAGVTGMAGLNLAKKMVSTVKYGKWKVYGLSRRKSDYLPPEVNHICCDLLDANMCEENLAPLTDVTHVFYTAWIDKGTDLGNVHVKANAAMMENLLKHMPARLQHFVLLTGGKYYIGGFDVYCSLEKAFPTPFKESFGRLPVQNFYYTLEDILFQKAAEGGFTWSVARPSILIGFAPFSLLSPGAAIAVYAAICKYSGKPLAFPGTETGYDILLDMTDPDVLAEHMMWQATDPIAKNQAYNVVNGDIFRWKQMWKVIADYFDLEVPDQVGPPVDPKKLEPIWDEMVEKMGLQPLKLDEVGTMWFMSLVLSMNKDKLMDMTKSREHGFLVYQNSEKTFIKLFDYMMEHNFIPRKASSSKPQ